MYAAFYDNLHCGRHLIERGADLNIHNKVCYNLDLSIDITVEHKFKYKRLKVNNYYERKNNLKAQQQNITHR